MGIANSVIGFVKDFGPTVWDSGPTVWKYVKYQIRPKDYERKFEAVRESLEDRLKDVEAVLGTQLHQLGKKARNEVDTWRKKAHEETTVKVEHLICQGGYFAVICSSRKLDEKTEELEQILEEGKEFTNAGVSLVIDDHEKKGVTLLDEKCIARDDLQDEILQLLRGDKVTRIAVCGMGGVGKTTIMKQVHNQLLEEPKFGKVIWVTVSKNFDVVVQQKKQFDIPKFQKSIARKLRLDLKNGDQDAIELAGLISDKLQRGSYVLILDDVWEPFSPEAVGIPDLVGNNGCKLVLTTRLQQEVGRAMKCEVIQVKPLLDDEALTLFLDKVGSEVVSYPRYKSDIEPFLNQILKKCNGLPLAIVLVAKTMRGKSDCYSWQMAGEELSNSEEIFDCLKFSYDHLEEQCKKCFLYCALYPEDHEILKEELIEFWIEEGFVKDGRRSRQLMNSEGHVILGKLIDNCMLKLVGHDEDCVSMHDLLREMALDISPQFMVKAGMALEELPEEHEWREDLLKVSLMNNNIREIPSSMSSPKCLMLTTLLLPNNNITTVLEAFFDQMLGLKVLDLSNNKQLGRLPSSISKLENLTTLLLEDCSSLKEVPSLSNLEGLKKLNLFGTSIEEPPQGLNMLTNLKYLHLDGKLSETPDVLLRNLSNLQHLEVEESIPMKGEEIGKLRKLEFLSGWFPTMDDMSLFVNSKRKLLNGYHIVVGSPKEEDDYSLKYIFSGCMKYIYCRHIDICGEANWLPSDAQGFCILDCKDVRSLNDISGFQNATDLQHCIVNKCDALEFVVSLCCLKSLQNLELLCLYDLPNLNAVFGEVGAIAKSEPLPAGTFSFLQKFEVLGCGRIKKLLPLRLLRYLQNLQTIEVECCNQMEEIIWSEYDGGGEKALEKLTLPKLEKLALDSLPALKSIYSGSTTVLICDSIKEIRISHCQEIGSVFWRGFNPLPTLEDLQLVDLENLKSVFDEETLGLSTLEKITLPKLQRLKLNNLPALKSIYSGSTTVLICDSIRAIDISHCREIESVFWRGFNPLPTLGYLRLWSLENLKSVFDEEALGLSTPPATFFSLKTINVSWCRKLKKVFSSERLLGCFQSLELIEVRECDQMEELISPSTYEEIEAPEKFSLPNLQQLLMVDCPELKSICSSSSVLICDSIKSLQIVDCEKLKRIPLYLSSLDNGQLPSLEQITIDREIHWESLEWAQSNAKDVLLRFCEFSYEYSYEYDSHIEEEALKIIGMGPIQEYDSHIEEEALKIIGMGPIQEWDQSNAKDCPFTLL